MTIDIGPIGSHGKARIISYGHDYPIPISLTKEERDSGFVNSEWHWDKVQGLIHEPYPLSPEEQAEIDAENQALAQKQLRDSLIDSFLANQVAWEETVRTLTDKVALLEEKIDATK